MNILYTCDNNYVWLMGISVISLFNNNRDIEEICVHLLGEKISDENKELLQSIAKSYKREINVIDVPKIDIPEALTSARWPLSAFTRLYAGELLPNEIKKVLYLDCDTIITGSVLGLDQFEVSDHIIYGVKDCIGCLYKENIGLQSEEQYVNAGVLLFNLERLRKVDVKSKINHYMMEYKSLINYADQDILNGIFHGEIGTIDSIYNVMTIASVHTYKEIKILRKPTNFYTEAELLKAVKCPVIIHYTTNMRIVRPWYSNADHPFTNEFRKYMQLSPWKSMKLKEMKFLSNDKKIIGLIMMLPDVIAYHMLGFIHAWVKPMIIRLKSKRRK